MHSTTFPLTWDLESLFKQQGQQNSLTKYLANISAILSELDQAIQKKSPLTHTLPLAQKVSEQLAEASSFIHCLMAEDTQNTLSLKHQEEALSLQAKLETLLLLMDETLKTLDHKTLKELIHSLKSPQLTFPLEERILLAQHHLPYSMESLISHLSIDGYHGYAQLFYILHSNLQFPLASQSLSIAQIDNVLHHPDRTTRSEAFAVYQKTFKEHESAFAALLNHIAGFRLQLYSARGWTNVLQEPLQCNRMQKATLDVMWHVINTHLSPFVSYLEKKAKIFGLSQLSWHDVEIPLEKNSKKIPYQEACTFILKQFEKYSPNMMRFAKHALQQGWVEVEDRKSKAAGGFCTGFPLKKESRIFMTYSGTQNNVATLAHELGHAYHNEKIFSHPYFAQNIKMNVAETASTMAEMIVADAALQAAKTKEEKISLLDDKISRSMTFFMNIQARFLFETAFYEGRKTGYVLPEHLSLLMEEAQKKAFSHALGEWHPHFWASKQHFYFTDVPFYNFPYTFGYLFSLGIYSLLKEHPSSFEKKYDALLHDTPLMTSEDLAKKHLQMDLTRPHFWELAMQEATKDVKTFFDLFS